MMKRDIFERSLAGEPVSQALEADGFLMDEAQEHTRRTVARLNAGCHDEAEIRSLLREIGLTVHETARVRLPFHTDFGRFTRIGPHVFINELCEFMDRGGITIEEHALIGPRVNLVTENHDLAPDRRLWLVSSPILIKRNAWIGAAATSYGRGECRGGRRKRGDEGRARQYGGGRQPCKSHQNHRLTGTANGQPCRLSAGVFRNSPESCGHGRVKLTSNIISGKK